MNSGSTKIFLVENHSRRTALLMFFVWTIICMTWWGLAFYPVSQSTPTWLARTQYVCFGSMPNGLPETYGWLLLIIAPLSMLAGLIVNYGYDFFQSIKDLLFQKRKAPILIFMIGLFFMQAVWTAGRIRDGFAIKNQTYVPQGVGSLPINYPRTNKVISPFELLDQRGNKVSLKSLQGKPVLFTFAFAHCATMCPVLIQQTTAVLKQMDSKKLNAVFVTLDPWRDTPSSLAALSDKWNLTENAHLLSGDPKLVTKIVDDFGLPWSRNEKTGNISHPPLVYILDKNGTIAYMLNNPTTEWLVNAIERLQ